VSAVCSNNITPCNSYINNQFNNLGYGIYTANITGNKPYLVQQSNFKGCFVGLYNKGVTAGTTLFNTFTLGKVPSPSIIPITNVGASTVQDQVGVMFENSMSGFTFEENDFNKESGNVTNTIGSICKNIGYFNNSIRKNRYTGIAYGNVSNDVNALNAINPPRGLNYICNINTNVSVHDFLITNGNIRKNQGLQTISGVPQTASYKASGNRFSYYLGNTESDFKNLGEALTYHYSPNSQNQTPLDITSSITTLTSVENECPTTYCKPPCKTKDELVLIKSDFYEKRKLSNELKLEYATLPSSQKADKIAFYQSKMDESAFMVILHALYDTTTYDLDTLRKWMGNINTLGSDLWLASDYIRTNENAKSINLLNTVSTKYNLNSEEQNFIDEYQKVLSLLSSQYVYGLTTENLGVLSSYAKSKGPASGLVQNILTWYGEHYPPSYSLYNTGERSHEFSNSSLNDVVIISPNPTNGYTTIHYNLPESTQNISILLTDINGRIEQVFDGLSSNGEISTTFKSSGLHFYQLLSNGRILVIGKIVVEK
jgi:hypothetical protein